MVRVNRGIVINRLFLAVGGAFGLWAYLLNRTIIQWVDGPHKVAAAAAVAATLGVIAVASAVRFWNRAWLYGWLAVLGLFALGECHLLWLRRKYQADSRTTAPWPAVTTTHLQVRQFAIEGPTLGRPRVRVVHLSDLHATNAIPESYAERVGRAVRALAPDVVVMTGDYVSRPERLVVLESWLEKLPQSPLGSYAVLGNHDHWTGHPEAVRGVLERAGFELVTGRCAELKAETEPSLAICGTEVPWGEGTSEGMSSFQGASLVLSHTPDNVYALADKGALAVFAGHTHAGQIRLPFLGALVVPSSYGRRFDEGHFIVDKTHLFVSAGVGADQPPLRLWCPPELVVVDLVASRKNERTTARP
jgi:predicted MPP superfamily phosphohydrolase